MMLTKLFNAFIKPQKTQVYKHWASNTIAFKVNNMSTDAIKVSFSSEDKEKILNVVNSRNIEKLLQYSITKKHAQNLELHLTNNGTFNSLEDLLKVKGMNKKCLYKFYNSIINDKKRTGPKDKRGLILAPKTISNQKNINTVLGIYIGTDMISWSLLNRECEVLQWCYEPFPENWTKENVHFLIQTILPIAIKLPKADRYVMQEIYNDKSSQQNRNFYFTYLQHSTIRAIIMTYLTTLNGEFDKLLVNNIFILRQNVLQKFYGLIIDNEVISTQYVLQNILQDNVGLMKTERLPHVLINPELKNMYNARSSTYQEQISWSLLIALALLETVVYKKTI